MIIPKMEGMTDGRAKKQRDRHDRLRNLLIVSVCCAPSIQLLFSVCEAWVPPPRSSAAVRVRLRNRVASRSATLPLNGKIIESSTSGSGGGSAIGMTTGEHEFQNINIDDVLLEAEAALQAAQDSLTTDDHLEKKTDSVSKLKTDRSAVYSPSPTTSSAKVDKAIPSMESVNGQALGEILSCTMGGILLGMFLGSIILIEYPDLANVLSLETLALPLIGGALLGVVGLAVSALAEASSTPGKAVRTILGKPTVALGETILVGVQFRLRALGLAAQRKAEETAQNVQSLPGKIADSVKTSVEAAAQNAVDEFTSLPRKATDSVFASINKVVVDVKTSVVESGVLEPDFFIAVVVVPSLIALVILVADGLVSGRDLMLPFPPRI